MTDVSRSNRCLPGKCDPRDLSVPYLDGPTCPLPSGDKRTGRIRGSGVKRQNPVVEVLAQHPLEGIFA